MLSISGSLRPGIIGAAITPVGTPARLNASMARSRNVGAEARGSILRASAPSSVVIDTHTRTRPRPAIRVRISTSRTTPADLVTMVTG